MGGLSLWHWTILLLVSLVWLVPFWRIVAKAGFSPAWVLLGLVPGLNVLMLWVFAFSRWPSQRDRA